MNYTRWGSDAKPSPEARRSRRLPGGRRMLWRWMTYAFEYTCAVTLHLDGCHLLNQGPTARLYYQAIVRAGRE